MRWMYLHWQKHQYMTHWDENALVQENKIVTSWHKISVIKMDVVATGETTVALLSFIINDLHLKSHR